MNVLIYDICRDDSDTVKLTVSIGSQPPRFFRATYDSSNAISIFGTLEEELFMTLSSLALRRFGNCTIYQLELMGLIAAFCRGERLPSMPARLGTTPFCKKPTLGRIVRNKCLIVLRHLGLYNPVILNAPARRGAT